MIALATALACLALPGVEDGYRLPPPEVVRPVDAPPTVSIAPDMAHMLIVERPSLPSIAEVAEAGYAPGKD